MHDAEADGTDPTTHGLLLQLLAWVGTQPRSYAEVMDAWRTSCPRLPVWEEATDRGLVRVLEEGGRMVVRVTPDGSHLLAGRP